MFDENLTGELLINDPSILGKYLDDLTGELAKPYFERKPHLFDEDLDIKTEEAITDLAMQEKHLKLLTEFVELFMDRTQEKVQEQNDIIKKMENEAKDAADLKSDVDNQLAALTLNFEMVSAKNKEVELALTELEEKYEKNRLKLMANRQEIAGIATLKQSLNETKEELNKQTLVNSLLNDERVELETKIAHLTSEYSQLERKIGAKELEINLVSEKTEEELEQLREKLTAEFNKEKAIILAEAKSYKELSAELTKKVEHLEADVKAQQVEILKQKNSTRSTRTSVTSRPATSNFPSEYHDDSNINMKLMGGIRMSKLFMGEEKVNQWEPEQYSPSTPGQCMCGFFENNLTTEGDEEDEFDGMRRSLGPDTGNSTLINALVTPRNVSKKINLSEPSTATTVKSDSKKHPGRKPIFEEYFTLTFQSALLNSPHFNDLVGKLDPKYAFNEINKQGIPFYEWHSFLGKLLDNVYKEKVIPTMSSRKKTLVPVLTKSKK